MQRTLLTLAMIAAAGTAVAQTASPPAAGSGSVTTPGASGATVKPPSTSAGATATPGMTPSATMNPPATSAGAAATPGMNQPSPGMSQPSPGMNQPSATYGTNTANASPRLAGQAGIAQKRIEADGYRNVQGLALGSDGLWHGRAMRGSAEVQVTVDKRGSVSQQ